MSVALMDQILYSFCNKCSMLEADFKNSQSHHGHKFLNMKVKALPLEEKGSKFSL